MPSLADALDKLAHESSQINLLSAHNERPAGPFTTAYLYLPFPGHHGQARNTNVLSLIRDADDSEVRPFRYVGEDAGASGNGGGAGGSVGEGKGRKGAGNGSTDDPASVQGKSFGTGTRHYELRSSHQLTPVRELRAHRGKAGEIDFALSAAAQVVDALVDSYRPMSRAKSHIHALIETHKSQVARIGELERQIADVQRPRKREPSPTSDQIGGDAEGGDANGGKPAMTVDEAIKAEEEALRALEAQIAPMRRAAALRSSTGRTPNKLGGMSPPTSRRALVTNSPRGAPGGASVPPSASTTPRAQRTPGRPMPVVTNSLVQGHTPNRQAPRASQFSPLVTLGTPRAPGGSLGSSLRASTSDEPRSIFGRPPRPTATPGRVFDFRQSATGTGLGASVASHTPQLRTRQEPAATPLPSVATPAVSSRPPPSPVTSTLDPPPIPPKSPERTKQVLANTVQGVEVDLPFVQPSVDKIWATLGDIMRMGSEPVEHTPEATVNHLYDISCSDPASPSSPSSVSTRSAQAGSAPPAVTSEAILLSHLCLSILRSGKSSGTAEALVPLPELKSGLAEACRARGWDAADDMASKTVYAAVGRRLVRIDRRGGGGGRVKFAE